MRVDPALPRSVLLILILCASALANARVETVRFQSKLINATLPYNVILPSDYNTSKTTRYPVLLGDHSWAYWDRQVQEVLKIAVQKIRLPPTKTAKGTRA